MSKATVLRMLAHQAEATATRTGRRDYRLVAADLFALAGRAEAEARAAAKRKRRSRSRRLGAGEADQVDLVDYLDQQSRPASRDTGPGFTGTGPQGRRLLRRRSGDAT